MAPLARRSAFCFAHGSKLNRTPKFDASIFHFSSIFFFCLQIIGAAMFIMTVWIRAEPGFEEWVHILNIHVYYIGIYILILAAFIVMVVSFLGCCSALMEHTNAIYLVSNRCVYRIVCRC